MHLPTRPSPDSPLTRETLITLIRAALNISENRYARLAALGWLGSYPGDLLVRLLYARALVQESLLQQALPVLEDLVMADPEYLEAQEALSSTLYLLGSELSREIDGRVQALGGKLARPIAAPKWAGILKTARDMLLEDSNSPHQKTAHNGSAQDIHDLVCGVVAEFPDNPLAAVTHLRIALSNQAVEPSSIRDIARAYHQRWTDCIPLKLILAEMLMHDGFYDQAMELIHQAATMDVAGQVPTRLWGSAHLYRSLWPEQLSIDPGSPSAPQSLPIPASIAAIFGWNQLPEGKTSKSTISGTAGFKNLDPLPLQFVAAKGVVSAACASHRRYTPPESLRRAQPEVEAIARQLKKPGLKNLDGRFPVYVILSSRSGLERQYGSQHFSQIDLNLRALLDAIAHSKRWGAMLYYVDDPELAPAKPSLNLKPAIPTDPWEVKLAVADLDAALGDQGEMLGALLIVGGAQVIPFHQLPNPVDDDDSEVISDNPYSTRDENYFIPEWPVGRIPGDSSNDPASLHNALQYVITQHRQNNHPLPWHRHLWRQVVHSFHSLLRKTKEPIINLGYSAAIWRRASLSVYRTIGEPRALLVSPPVQIQSPCPISAQGSSEACMSFPPSRLGYFNLHGLADAEEWFGQRDPTEPMPGPDYPVALRPQDIGSNGAGGKNHIAPEIVFSEACYGAHIQQKTVDQSISLKFLSSGTKAFVGSTCISYGSISTPLIAADLLGRAFWNFVQEGYPTGEALRRAKIYLAREMHNRQGYLDGEDQKTLISFILYGDPLAQTIGKGKTGKSILRQMNAPHVPQTICDRAASTALSQAIPQEITKQVKQVVADYLPGMQNASVRLSRERAGCQGENHTCPSAQLGTKTLPGTQPNRQVVVLSKTVKQFSHNHAQYARLTLDASGKLVKLVVSR